MFLHQLLQVDINDPHLSLSGILISDILLEPGDKCDSFAKIIRSLKVTIKEEQYKDKKWLITTTIPDPLDRFGWISRMAPSQLEDYVVNLTYSKRTLVQLVHCIGFPIWLLDTSEGITLIAEQYRKWWHEKIHVLSEIKTRDEHLFRSLGHLRDGVMGKILCTSIGLIDEFNQRLIFTCDDNVKLLTKVLDNTDTLHDWRDFVVRFKTNSIDFSTGVLPSIHTRITIMSCGHHMCVHDIIPYMMEEIFFTKALLYNNLSSHESSPQAKRCLICQRMMGTNCIAVCTNHKKRWCKENPNRKFKDVFPKIDDFPLSSMCYIPGHETNDPEFQRNIENIFNRSTQFCRTL
jgi:hypothetical protein